MRWGHLMSGGWLDGSRSGNREGWGVAGGWGSGGEAEGDAEVKVRGGGEAAVRMWVVAGGKGRGCVFDPAGGEWLGL